MIQASELRIGNNLHDFNGKLVEVLSIKTNNIRCIYKRIDTNTSHVSLYHNEELHRIPITPEILEKCGFVTDEEMGVSRLFTDDFSCDYYDGCLWFKTSQIEIKYLHQLQNLCYALTGNELNYQP